MKAKAKKPTWKQVSPEIEKLMKSAVRVMRRAFTLARSSGASDRRIVELMQGMAFEAAKGFDEPAKAPK
jgi:hypothetical protein